MSTHNSSADTEEEVRLQVEGSLVGGIEILEEFRRRLGGILTSVEDVDLKNAEVKVVEDIELDFGIVKSGIQEYLKNWKEISYFDNVEFEERCGSLEDELETVEERVGWLEREFRVLREDEEVGQDRRSDQSAMPRRRKPSPRRRDLNARERTKWNCGSCSKHADVFCITCQNHWCETCNDSIHKDATKSDHAWDWDLGVPCWRCGLVRGLILCRECSPAYWCNSCAIQAHKGGKNHSHCWALARPRKKIKGEKEEDCGICGGEKHDSGICPFSRRQMKKSVGSDTEHLKKLEMWKRSRKQPSASEEEKRNRDGCDFEKDGVRKSRVNDPETDSKWRGRRSSEKRHGSKCKTVREDRGKSRVLEAPPRRGATRYREWEDSVSDESTSEDEAYGDRGNSVYDRRDWPRRSCEKRHGSKIKSVKHGRGRGRVRESESSYGQRRRYNGLHEKPSRRGSTRYRGYGTEDSVSDDTVSEEEEDGGWGSSSYRRRESRGSRSVSRGRGRVREGGDEYGARRRWEGRHSRAPGRGYRKVRDGACYYEESVSETSEDESFVTASEEESSGDSDWGRGDRRWKMPSMPREMNFSGQGGTWKAFEGKFRCFLETWRVPENKMFYVLNQALSGEAADCFQTMVDMYGVGGNINKWLSRLRKRFDDTRFAEAALVELNTMRQRRGEDLREWARRVAMVAAAAHPKMLASELERQILTRFILGLHDQETTKQLTIACPKTVQAAIQICNRYQWVTGHVGGAKGEYQVRVVGQKDEENGGGSGTRSRSASPSAPMACFKCGSYAHMMGECPYSDRVCFICKEVGHRSRECPNKEKVKATEGGTWKSARRVQFQGGEGDPKGEGLGPEAPIQST